MNIKITVNAAVADGTDLQLLRQRVADQLRQISNPVREDQGITSVSSVIVDDGAHERSLNEKRLRNLSELIQDDLICLLDGQEQALITDACQIVVDKVNGLTLQILQSQSS